MAFSRTNYAGSLVNIVPAELASAKVTISSNVGRGNGGTSLPCKKVWMQAALTNASYVLMNVAAAATSVLGITLPGSLAGTTITAVLSVAIVPPPMEMEIDDVSKLYFWGGTDGDVVNMIYRC